MARLLSLFCRVLPLRRSGQHIGVHLNAPFKISTLTYRIDFGRFITSPDKIFEKICEGLIHLFHNCNRALQGLGGGCLRHAQIPHNLLLVLVQEVIMLDDLSLLKGQLLERFLQTLMLHHLKISRSNLLHNVRHIGHHADLCVAVRDGLLCASEISCIVGFQTVLCNQGHVDVPLIVHILLNRDEAVLIGEPIQHSIHVDSCEDGIYIIADIEDKTVAIHGQQGIVHLELSHNWHHGIAQLTEAGLLYAFSAVLDVLPYTLAEIDDSSDIVIEFDVDRTLGHLLLLRCLLSTPPMRASIVMLSAVMVNLIHDVVPSAGRRQRTPSDQMWYRPEINSPATKKGRKRQSSSPHKSPQIPAASVSVRTVWYPLR
ncbi:hypothetical protein CU012_1646 [Enterococcus faecium]|nr:hypothetical protein [Enterococcus faecium]